MSKLFKGKIDDSSSSESESSDNSEEQAKQNKPQV